MKQRTELNTAILDDLSARTGWDSRQKLWYEMRHHGLRRKHKPWPNAADLHYPLADSIIAKLKPFYLQQIYATDLIAQFTPWQTQAERLTTEAMMWFDYNMRQSSNFETEIQTAVDLMLMSGLSLIKTTWDVECGRLRFDAVHPLYIVVPAGTQNLQETTRLAHIMPMSVDTYNSRPLYNQSPEFVRSITGRGSEMAHSFAWEQIKDLREGLTTGARENEIIVWEVYEKVEGRWMVHTFSPLRPDVDIRPTMELTYDHGKLPFTAIYTEIKDKGFYSARGIPEQVAPFEASLCKMWNEKHDAMTVYNRPLFRAEHEMPNSINLKFQPGQILPFGVSPLPMPTPPISFDQEMEHTRQIAENLIAVPDLGIGGQQSLRKSRTATEINALSGLLNQNVDMRARIFRLGLGEIYAQAWGLLRQYAIEELEYYHSDNVGTVTVDALQNDYVIHPSGSADGANRGLMLQKALQRMQLLANNRNINQAELVRSVLEIDDPKLVRRLMQDTNGVSNDQIEEQAKECLLLEAGFPVQISATDDDELHIQTLVGRLKALGVLKQAKRTFALQRMIQHLMAHLAQLQQKNPTAAQMWRQNLEKLQKAELTKTASLQSRITSAKCAQPTKPENKEGVVVKQRETCNECAG